MSAYSVIFEGLHYLGPGDAEITKRIVKQIAEYLPTAPRIADFGCGKGASTLELAKILPKAHILALDIHMPFIQHLSQLAQEHGLNQPIEAVVGDMAKPPALDGINGEFDLIWSESAIYAMGRSLAFTSWNPLINPGGILAFSDIVWQRSTEQRSIQGTDFWTAEYPDIQTIDSVLSALKQTGYETFDPEICERKVWSNYYEPLRARLVDLSHRKDNALALIEVIDGLTREIDIYDQTDDVSVVFFTARKI